MEVDELEVVQLVETKVIYRLEDLEAVEKLLGAKKMSPHGSHIGIPPDVVPCRYTRLQLYLP